MQSASLGSCCRAINAKCILEAGRIRHHLVKDDIIWPRNGTNLRKPEMTTKQGVLSFKILELNKHKASNSETEPEVLNKLLEYVLSRSVYNPD